MDEFQGSGQALRPASAYRPSAVASGSDFARAKSPWKEEGDIYIYIYIYNNGSVVPSTGCVIT